MVLCLIPAQDADGSRKHGMRLGADADKIQFAVSVDRGLDRRLELGRRHQCIGTRHPIQCQE